MKIGNVNIDSRIMLAPLAGITDIAFRQVCRNFGAGYAETEMVSAKALSFNDKKSYELMELGEDEHPCAIQIFGNEPDIMADAAVLAEKRGADIVDINMGCPAPKIANNGSGSALMKNPVLCGEIVKSVSSAVKIPVTVKIRKGFDDNCITALDVARICEENGADAIIIHGRTRKQYYSGQCDLDIIKSVKNAVDIPVIGNGDVKDIKSAEKMFNYTGCDGIMVARAALGNPWIFKILNEYFDKGIIIPPPDPEEKMKIMTGHIELVCKNKGEKMGMLQSRKQISWYIKGFKGAAAFRNEAGRVCTLSDMYSLVDRVLQNIGS